MGTCAARPRHRARTRACLRRHVSGTIVHVIADLFSHVPLSVWLALGALALIFAVAFVKDSLARTKGLGPAPLDVRKAGQEDQWNEITANHPVIVRGSRKAMATDPHARLLAPAIPYALCHENPVDTLELTDRTATRNMLAWHWSIRDRRRLITQLYALLRDGHRKDYEFLRRNCADRAWAESMIDTLNETAADSTDDWEDCWRICRFLNNDRDIWTLDFAAWDFIRAAMLTRAGAGLGWLSEEEAWDTLALINRALQSCYSSWEEAWEAFRTTRWLWAAEGEAQGATDDLHDRIRGNILLGKAGLWTAIPWDAPYPAPRFLVREWVASEGALPDPDVCSFSVELPTAWEKELDAQSHARLTPRSRYLPAAPSKCEPTEGD